MSKRKSQTAITAYREQGYLPEAMVNFLAFLGWSPGTEEEIFSLAELAERFEIGEVHKAGAVFDKDRLDYLNGVYIRSLNYTDLAARLRPFLPEALSDEQLLRLVPLLHERLVRLSDATELAAFLTETDAQVAALYEPELLLPKGRGQRRRRQERWLPRATHWPAPSGMAEALEAAGRAAADAHGWKPGDFFRPIRVAVTGRLVSPPLFGSMELLGKEQTLARIDAARARLEG